MSSIPLRPVGRYTVELREAARQALEAGAHIEDVAAQLNLSVRTLFRWKKRFRTAGNYERTLYDRIMARVKREGDCLIWQGSRNEQGYGKIGGGGTQVYAHRAVWEHHNGPVPEGKLVCHSCDNPPCCEIEHLWLGTNGDNAQDALRKGRLTGGRGIPRNRRAWRISWDELEFCPSGHRLADVGLYTHRSRGTRYCRACLRDSRTASRKRLRARSDKPGYPSKSS